MNLYIIHQYGEPEHFRSLTALKDKTHGSLNLFFADFRCKDDLYNGLIHGDIRKFRKGICSLFNFVRSILDKDGVIIYGLAYEAERFHLSNGTIPQGGSFILRRLQNGTGQFRGSKILETH